jgi:hypothetical protein
VHVLRFKAVSASQRGPDLFVLQESEMRRAAKRDDNHADVVKALRSAGCWVLDLGSVGNGCPDLLVHGPTYPWTLRLLEIKDGKKSPSARVLTPDQIKFHGECRGLIYVVHSTAEALEVMGVK